MPLFRLLDSSLGLGIVGLHTSIAIKMAIVNDGRGAATNKLFDLDGVQLHLQAQHLLLVVVVDGISEQALLVDFSDGVEACSGRLQFLGRKLLAIFVLFVLILHL